MRSDALLAFVPIGGNLSLVGAAGIAIPSTNIIDLLGQGSGQAPANIIGNAAVFGEDPGVGAFRPELNVLIGTALATGNAATLNIALQAAIDTGAGGGYLPGTWTTIVESGAMAVANLVAGAVPFRVPWLPTFPANLRPRFLRLLFSPAAATNFTAGTISSAIVTLVRDDQANKFAAKNYSVS